MQPVHADDVAIVQLAHEEEELGLSSRVRRDDLMHASQRRHVGLRGRQVASKPMRGASGTLSSGPGGGLRCIATAVHVALLPGAVVQQLH